MLVVSYSDILVHCSSSLLILAGQSAVETWVDDITRYQIHKFLIDLPAINSLYKVGSAAAHFAALPMPSTVASRKELQRQLQRAGVALLRSLAKKSLNAGAAVAGAASASGASGKLRGMRDRLR